MIITILRNLFSKPATRQYPFKDVREPVKDYRGKIVFVETKCKLCGACSRACPAKAIDVNRQGRQIKYYPWNCIYCSSCVEACPADAIIQEARYTAPATSKGIDIYNVPAPPPAPAAPDAPPAAT